MGSVNYVLDGCIELEVTVGEEKHVLTQGGYAYAPAGVGIGFHNVNGKEGRILLYKQRYIPHPKGLQPWAVFGNINDVAFRDYDGMANVHVKDFLPINEAFDMNMHILSFDPGASHNICETHVQEHGAYIYEGEGMYLLDDVWYPTKAEDFLWMGAFSVQAAYGIGRGPFSYLYSKDCHLDVDIESTIAHLIEERLMAFDMNFKARDIREVLDVTHMRGRNITFLDDFKREEILNLYRAAEMLEPFMRTGTNLL
ncbi:MAG: (S)-ureidoglycine aminohydrolase [Sutterella sp.]|nr:(S)-ureidoglycine aminohydrolase [Sutterella sp.]